MQHPYTAFATGQGCSRPVEIRLWRSCLCPNKHKNVILPFWRIVEERQKQQEMSRHSDFLFSMMVMYCAPIRLKASGLTKLKRLWLLRFNEAITFHMCSSGANHTSAWLPQTFLAVPSYSPYGPTCMGGPWTALVGASRNSSQRKHHGAAKSYVQDNKAADDSSGPCQVQFVHFPEASRKLVTVLGQKRALKKLCKRYILIPPSHPITRPKNPDSTIIKQHRFDIIHFCHGHRTTGILEFPKPIPISSCRH